MGGWLIPRLEEAWFEVGAGEPSEVHLWVQNDAYLLTTRFISQADAESFIRWCLVDDRDPVRTTRRGLPEEWPRQPRAWLHPESASWELFVERGVIKGHWWWLLLVADHQPTAVAGTFGARDEALGFLRWLREYGPQLNVERVERSEDSLEEEHTWLTEMEEEIDRKQRGQQVDLEEALAEMEQPKRAGPDLFELMRRHEARNRSVEDDFLGGNGA